MPKFPDVNCDARVPSSIWHAERPANPMLETQLVAPRKGAIRKFITRLPMSSAQKAAAIASAPDRLVMREHIFPEVARRAGNILFVGTRAYTADYPAQFEEHGGLCWTIDRDAKAAPYGATGRHVTGSVTEIDTIYPVTMFRTIVLTGVLGFGVNRFSDQLRALEACSIALERGGMLVLGWNDRRLHPGVLEEAASRWFDFRDFGHLPSRIWVSGYDHNFAFFRRRPAVS